MTGSADAGLLEQLQDCPSLPSLPAVALELIELAQHPEPALYEVAAAIGRDPALTAKLLRVANSPLYGQSRSVTNLRRALIVLGMGSGLSIALSFTLAGMLAKASAGYFECREFWRRSLIVAVLAREFGGRARCGDREMLFLAGLLQDIGMLVLATGLPQRYAKVFALGMHDHWMQTLCEHTEFGIDHVAIGAWLLDRWHMPQVYVEAVRNSHVECLAGLQSLMPNHQQFCAAVAVANDAALLWYKEPNALVVQAISGFASAMIGIGPAVFVEALDAVTRTLPEMAALLEIDVGSPLLQRNLIDLARATLLGRCEEGAKA